MLMVKRLAGPSVQYDKVRLYPAEPFQMQFGLVNMRKVKFPVDPVMQMLCFGFEFLSARVCLMLLQPLLRIEIVRKYMRLDEGFPIIRKRIVDCSEIRKNQMFPSSKRYDTNGQSLP